MTNKDNIEPPHIPTDDDADAPHKATKDEQTIDEQQRIHEEELIEEEHIAEDRQLTKIKEIEEYKLGKILYEEVLTGMLQQANTAYQRNKHTTFCRTVQSIWNNCYRADRDEIYKEVKKIAKKQMRTRIVKALKKEMMELKDDKTKERWKKGLAKMEKKTKEQSQPIFEPVFPEERILSVETFDTLMRANLSNPMEKGFLLRQNWYGTEWRLSYQIIQETIRKKYHGTVKQYTKDKLEG